MMILPFLGSGQTVGEVLVSSLRPGPTKVLLDSVYLARAQSGSKAHCKFRNCLEWVPWG